MEVEKKLNDKIYAILSTFDNNKYKLGYERRVTLQKSIKSNRDVSLILLVASVLVGLVSGFYFIRIITIRI
ncbi:MAG: hypothetical protein JNJ40_03585 [Bacteroidia bacterium]|nr:hypothetical protein [Bacteroidia bacterium]